MAVPNASENNAAISASQPGRNTSASTSQRGSTEIRRGTSESVARGRAVERRTCVIPMAQRRGATADERSALALASLGRHGLDQGRQRETLEGRPHPLGTTRLQAGDHPLEGLV